MERVFIGLNIAVLAVAEAESGASDACRRLAVDRLGGAGHTIAQESAIDDNVQQIRAKLLEYIADAGIDVVVVVAPTKSESAGIALDPMITRPLDGFSDLLRMIAYQELGSAAMLIDAEAAQCKQTYVFLVPGSVPAMNLALEKLLLPQLDYRTTPRNLVMGLARIKHQDSGVVEEPAPPTETNKQPAPWIVPRAPGEPAPAPSTRAGAGPAVRRSMQMGVAVPLAKASVSDIVEKTAVSVSQRMPIVEGAAPPPPPPPPRRVTATLPQPVEVKAPAKLIPLAELLPVPSPTPAVVEPAPAPPPPESVRENSESTPTTPEHTFEVRRFPTPLPVAMDKVVVGPELSGPRKMISLADLEKDEDDELEDSEKITSGELIPPSGEINIAALAGNEAAGRAQPEPVKKPAGTPAMGTRTTAPPPTVPARPATTPPVNKPALAAIAAKAATPTPARGTGVSVHAQKEPASTRAATVDDRRRASATDPPRSIAEPPERRNSGGRLALVLIGLLLLGATAVIAAVLIRNHDRDARAAAVDPAPDPQLSAAEPDPTPPADEPPPSNPTPPPGGEPNPMTEAIQPPPEVTNPATTEPTGPEIDMSSPDPNVPKKRPRTPTPPKDPLTTPAADPADSLATAPISKVDDGCDEVSCILDKYRQACCAKFKPAEPPQDPKPENEKPPSGLPEKLDKLMVQEGMAGVKPTVIACGERIAAKGTVKVAVKVSGSGKVVSATAIESPDPELGSCVASAVKLAKFPETDEGGSFNYPFAF